MLDQIKVRDLTLDVKAYGWDGCIIDLNGRKDLESITLNVDGCTIEAGAFCGCDNLKHVNLHYNIRVEDDAFDGENAYLNKFVDLALPSGSLWARIDVDGKPRFEVLPNKNFAINMGGTPTRDQMKELYSSCSWKETDNGWVGRSQYNGQEILLSKEGFKKIWTAYSIQYRYEYASITGPDAALQTKTLTDLGAKGFDIVSANPTAIILRREIKL